MGDLLHLEGITIAKVRTSSYLHTAAGHLKALNKSEGFSFSWPHQVKSNSFKAASQKIMRLLVIS